MKPAVQIPVVIQGRSPGNASSSGPGYNIVRTALGRYTLSFTRPIRNPVFTGTVEALTQSANLYTIGAIPQADGTIQVATNSATTAADLAFSFVVVGSEAPT